MCNKVRAVPECGRTQWAGEESIRANDGFNTSNDLGFDLLGKCNLD